MAKSPNNMVQVDTNKTPAEPGTIVAKFNKLDGERSTVLKRARECAELTIPALMPPQGHSESSDLPTPYQSFGARATNNLASKLILTLFPPNDPFFRLAVDDQVLKDAAETDLQMIEEALSKTEHAVMDEIEIQSIRVSAYEAAKLLIVTGNTLAYLPDEGGMKVYRLDQYVIRRDPMGHTLELIVKELVGVEALPTDIRALVAGKMGTDSQKDTVDLYTRVWRENDEWNVAQEAGGVSVPSASGTYPIDDCPWLPLRWSAITGENYGRGLVDEYLGDLRSLEGLNQAILDFAAAAAKILFLANPNGITKVKDCNDAQSGDFVVGRREDIACLQMDKSADFKIAYDTAQNIEQRLAQAFLLMSSVQRQAERVTAEEIRLMASELEDALGGVYSVLSQEMQRPLVKRLMTQMTKLNKIPALPKKTIQPMIVAGLEALGRGHEVDKVMRVVQAITGTFGPQVAAQYLSVGNFATRLGTGYGVNVTGLVRSDQEVAQAEQQAQVTGLAQAAGPGVAKELTKGYVDGQTAQAG
jgi:hypothetical protein